MGFLTLLTPANLYLKAKIALVEHWSASALKDEGVKLAPGQTKRLLSSPEIENFNAVIVSHAMPSLLFLTLVVGAGLLYWRSEKSWSYLIAVGFLTMCVPVAMLGYQLTIPFLILGAITVVASTFISYLFERARKLKDVMYGQ